MHVINEVRTALSVRNFAPNSQPGSIYYALLG